jgi:hypothetical protein
VDKARFEGGCWPTHEQEMLLKACLLQGPGVVAAWEEWKTLDLLDRLDLGSYRLLPLLYHNLRLHGIEDALIGRLKGIHRLTWYQNQLLFRLLVDLLKMFDEASIETMLLKGAALIDPYYHDRGLRLIGDLDVLVHPEQLPAAIDLLDRLAWKPITRSQKWEIRNSLLRFRHAQEFQDTNGQRLDLHWHVLVRFLPVRADEDFWDGAQSITVDGVHSQTLNPTDQLLHVCVHGAAWSPVPPIRWAADAMMILRAAGAKIDWQRLEILATKHRVHLPLRDTLDYLNDHLEASISPVVLERLRSYSSTRQDQREYRAATHPNPLWGRVPMLWIQYWRLTGESMSIRGLLGFLRLLQDTWEADKFWQMPFQAISRGARRIWRLVSTKNPQMIASSPRRNPAEKHR